jgi:hypothetical protein
MSRGVSNVALTSTGSYARGKVPSGLKSLAQRVTQDI